MAPDRGNNPTRANVAFCVGATKAGTSWLYGYLQDHPDCHLRSIKELHYFDALDFREREFQVRALEKNRAALIDRLETETDNRLDNIRRQILDHDDLISLHRGTGEDRDAYLGYLNGGGEGHLLVADLTPAYSLLSAGRFAKMAAMAAKTRFIYILRDPVARLWSHVRMNAARRANDPKEVQARANRIFWRFGRGRHQGIWERGDYRATLERLKKALAPTQLLVLFYEELFSQVTINRICAFLGIGQYPASFAVPVHVGPKADLGEDQRRHAQQWLAPQYEYVRNTFGRVPAEWRSNMPEVIT